MKEVYDLTITYNLADEIAALFALELPALLLI